MIAIDMIIRPAEREEVPVVTALVNRAYEVERFFVEGERTSESEIHALVAEHALLVGLGERGEVVGCVHVGTRDECGYFGLLAVLPAAQGQGWGRRLIDAAEAYARAEGRRQMEIDVVNLRTDLFEFYVRLGYTPRATSPYVNRPTIRPCYFVVMRKAL